MAATPDRVVTLVIVEVDKTLEDTQRYIVQSDEVQIVDFDTDETVSGRIISMSQMTMIVDES